MSNLQFVTITGADDSIAPELLAFYSHKYPFVEWGILVSKYSSGEMRFPTKEWLDELCGIWQAQQKENEGTPIKLSGHICGRWVRDILDGRWFDLLWKDSCLRLMFQRFQLNFHAYVYDLKYPSLFENGLHVVKETYEDGLPEIIFQMDGVNDTLLHSVRAQGIEAKPLFDISGGRGTLPGDWPKGIPPLSGYAGGLSPENIEEQLPLIEEASNGIPFWVDLETHVRSDKGKLFDLTRVEEFLKKVTPFITQGGPNENV